MKYDSNNAQEFQTLLEYDSKTPVEKTKTKGIENILLIKRIYLVFLNLYWSVQLRGEKIYKR